MTPLVPSLPPWRKNSIDNPVYFYVNRVCFFVAVIASRKNKIILILIVHTGFPNFEIFRDPLSRKQLISMILAFLV